MTLNTIPYAPDMNTVRFVKINDAALPTARKFGVNCADYDYVVVNLILKNSCTAANVEPHYWSNEAGAFLPLATPVVVSVPGARVVLRVARSVGVFFEVTGIVGGVPANDRVFVEVSGLLASQEVG
jgi:hypothetical protein